MRDEIISVCDEDFVRIWHSLSQKVVAAAITMTAEVETNHGKSVRRILNERLDANGAR